MKWFGEPWPSDELRAAVCEDDNDRVPLPAGEICALCNNWLEPDAQGVVLPHMEPSKTMPSLWFTELRYSHIDCLITNVMPTAGRVDERG